MPILGRIKKNAYFDSVTLMQVGKELSGIKGVGDAAVVMGTKSNLGILESSGLLLPEFKKASDTDLLIAVKAADRAVAESALKQADTVLARSRKQEEGKEETKPANIDSAMTILPGANMAMISVAGRYAADVAMDALKRGLHVMLFSDNVSLEQEIELKKFGQKKGLLVMGPDCGTAIINGVPLAFSNVVSRGNIGVVAAAGTGLQEVSTIISNEGAGISQAIGTGGRDVKEDVGGIMFIEGLKALARDSETKVILLVSKPPHKKVLAKVNRVIRGIRKPVVSLLLGAETKAGGPTTLEQAALMAVALSGGRKPEGILQDLEERDIQIDKIAVKEAKKLKKRQKYLRGLFSGGTFCSEAQLIMGAELKNIYSNAPAGRARQMADAWKSHKNTIVDLGEDEFTVGRPHPMIDFSLRNRRILEEGNDPETAVILLDVVLGYGSNMDPASELSAVIRTVSKKVSVVCSVTGTDMDPQNKSEVQKALRRDGAIVMPSNAAACSLATRIVKILGD